MYDAANTPNMLVTSQAERMQELPCWVHADWYWKSFWISFQYTYNSLDQLILLTEMVLNPFAAIHCLDRTLL